MQVFVDFYIPIEGLFPHETKKKIDSDKNSWLLNQK